MRIHVFEAECMLDDLGFGRLVRRVAELIPDENGHCDTEREHLDNHIQALAVDPWAAIAAGMVIDQVCVRDMGPIHDLPCDCAACEAGR